MERVAFSAAVRALCSLILLLVLSNIASSQTRNPQALPQPSPKPAAPQAQPSPSPKPTSTLEREFFRNILNDQVAIWTSPFHIARNDANYLVPIGLTTAALIATDRRSSDGLIDNGDSNDRVRISLQVSRLGAIYTTGGIAGAFYLVGVAKHDARARETGILGAEALIDAGIVSTVLKQITQRPRPQVPAPDDDFLDGGNSFPSGHATAAWALATVVANEYGDRKAVQITAYALAAVVSISRYTGRVHFLSDVFVGSAIGYGIGRYVYKKHHRSDSVYQNGQPNTTFGNANWVPTVTPLYSGLNRTYGISLTWRN